MLPAKHSLTVTKRRENRAIHCCDSRITGSRRGWERYGDISAYMRDRDGAMPAQNDSAGARVQYRWIEAQRRQYDAGTLAQDRVDALDRLGEWIGTRKGDPEEL